jgi:Ca2+-binding EF-hand superfamily protein
MFVATLLMTTAATVAAEDSSLFAQLDKNKDGKVTSDEVSSSQQTFFRRALRVADRNEDGALNPTELAAATTDVRPLELPGTNVSDRMANFDPKTLDRNSDGMITAEEVPAPLKDRFQTILDRIGKDSIAVDQLQSYLRGDRPQPQDGKSDSKSGNRAAAEKGGESMMSMDSDDQDSRIAALVRRIDANGNGRIERDEQGRYPQLAAILDRNRDGRISADEIQGADAPQIMPRMLEGADSKKGRNKNDEEMDRGRPAAEPNKRPGTGTRGRSAMDNPGEMFGQLDRNADGKLSSDEIPARMKANIDAADTDKDGSISQQEFQAALRRRLQNQK